MNFSIFRDRQQGNLFFIMVLSTLFCFALSFVRLTYIDFEWTSITGIRSAYYHRGHPTFLFLIWNLFLAWIPYWISLSLNKFHSITKSKIIIGCLLISWLLFLPNAPYILTDLLHLKSRSPIPHWYDVMLFITYAWTGMMLGLISLYEVQLFIQKNIGKRTSYFLVFCCIPLTGFGIFLGRFQRWNSWDIITNPVSLFTEIFETILNPAMSGNRLGLALIISVFLGLGYMTMLTMLQKK